MAAMRVLIVEDDAMIGILLAEMLGELGYNICAVVATEDDAVADAARHSPGLMIVDENLREGSGRSAVDRILRTRAVPCVFISGSLEHRPRAGEMSLRKPFTEADLVRAIVHVIGEAGVPVPSEVCR
jgi:DNA-binding response OmpR family regulator